jgi:hypothetical protein
MYLTAIGLVAWIVIGTIVIRGLLRRQLSGPWGRLLVLAPAVIFAAAPAVLLRCSLVPYSLVSFFAACIALFWFPILAARMRHAI